MKLGKRVFVICFAMTLGAFIIMSGTFGYYYETSPREPHPNIGEIYKLENHGDIFYVTKTISDIYWYSFYCFMFGVLLSAAIYIRVWPKKFGLGRTRRQ